MDNWFHTVKKVWYQHQNNFGKIDFTKKILVPWRNTKKYLVNITKSLVEITKILVEITKISKKNLVIFTKGILVVKTKIF